MGASDPPVRDDSLAVDAQALAALDSWLQADDAGRSDLLNSLRAQSPAVHARLQGLLRAAPATLTGAGLARADRLVRGFQAGDVVGPFRLLDLLGRGGMAEVWRAERADGLLQRRQVAIKLPWLMPGSQVSAVRFAREREALAALEHPHIAALYDAGVLPGGQPYLVLERVDGEPITEWCQRLQLPLAVRLGLCLQVCAAVAHAHRHLVVHRDLKPSNILVDRAGQVKLLDFGIARLLDDAATECAALTREAGGAMTPAYAAPEQVNQGPISTATDVFALGVLLYELLTGLLPHGDAATPWPALADAVLHRVPPPPSRVAELPGLNADLDTVVGKALRKLPAERYGTVDQLADDLRCVLARRPVAARPVGWGHRAALFVRRHRGATLATTLGAGALAVATGLALGQYQKALQQQARAGLAAEFLFDTVAAAEADEAHPDAVGGPAMLDAALARARLQLVDQPLLQAQVLGELGRLHGRLGQPERGRPVLREALGLLQRHALADDPARHIVAAQLAGQLLSDDTPGAAQEAERLAQQVLGACRAAGRPCAKARAYARAALVSLASGRGDQGLALAEAGQAVDDTAEAFGPQHPEMVSALGAQLVVARNAGRYAEAQQALDRAEAIAATTRLSAADRRALLRNHALVDLDMGRYAPARQSLQRLLGQTPQPAEQAVLLRLMATASLGLDAPAEALAAASQARALAETASDVLERWLAQQAQARAWLQQGRSQEARAALQAVQQGLAELGFAPGSFERRRARRYEAEACLRAGDAATAASLLQALLPPAGQVVPGGPLEQAQLLDTLGQAERERGQSAQALAHHAAAQALWAQAVPVTHPLRARNAWLSAAAQAPQIP